MKPTSTSFPKPNLEPQQVSPMKALYPTLDEMSNIPFMVHKWHELALKYGAIQIIPPKGWKHPACRLLPSNKFYTREHVSPIAPFNGRVTSMDDFFPSETMITLDKFKEYAAKVQAELGYEDVPTIFGEEISDEALVILKRNEARFFDMMQNGLGEERKEVKLHYAVDVEAEGAYDPATKSYNEYTVDGDDCLKHPENQEHEITGKEEEGKEQVDVGKGLLMREVEEEASKAAPVKTREEGRKVLAKSDTHLRRTNPASHVGNVNDHGVLRHSPAAPGINRPMFYVGASGTKFCFHVEDMFLNSVSYMHESSAVKVWYVIPSHQAELVEQYAREKVFDMKCFEKESLSTLLAAKATMMDPFDMAKYGISVYRVCQTPGTFVITAPQGYHGGFNCGFNVMEAVNFANPDWFVFGRTATEIYAKEGRESAVAFEFVVFNEARSLCKKANKIGEQTLKVDTVFRTYARLVAKELKHFAVDMEDTIREYAIAARAHLATIQDLEQRFTLPSLHPAFGNGAGLSCSVCNYQAHFYASTCATCEDKLNAKCVKCFRKGSRVCKKKGHKVVIARRHPPLLLLDMLNELERIAGISVSTEERMKRIDNITENWRLPKPKGNNPRLKCTLNLSRSFVPADENLVHPPYAEDLCRKRKQNEKKRKRVVRTVGNEIERVEDGVLVQRKKARSVKEEDEGQRELHVK